MWEGPCGAEPSCSACAHACVLWQVEMGGDVRVVCGGHARVRFHVFGWLYVSLVARWCVCCRVPLMNEQRGVPFHVFGWLYVS